MKRWLIGLLLLTSVSGFAGHKRDWQTGRIVSYEVGSFQHLEEDGTYTHPVCSMTLNVGEYTYFASRRLSAFRWSHCPTLTENAEAKYVIDKDSLIVLDDVGKEFQMRITKRRKN
ncbi:MAG: hypothetical protein ACHP7P_06460 [Terriglobales bacterium]